MGEVECGSKAQGQLREEGRSREGRAGRRQWKGGAAVRREGCTWHRGL